MLRPKWSWMILAEDSSPSPPQAPQAEILRLSSSSFVIPSIAGKIGDYKLCYQSPSGSDSVEQKSKDGVVQVKAGQVRFHELPKKKWPASQQVLVFFGASPQRMFVWGTQLNLEYLYSGALRLWGSQSLFMSILKRCWRPPQQVRTPSLCLGQNKAAVSKTMQNHYSFAKDCWNSFLFHPFGRLRASHPVWSPWTFQRCWAFLVLVQEIEQWLSSNDYQHEKHLLPTPNIQ